MLIEQATEPAPWGQERRGDYNPLVPTVFHEQWWLDIATGGEWEVVESIHQGRVIGRMPYLRTHRWWFNTINMPPLTHFLGPAVDPGNGSANTRLLRQISITRDLIRQLPLGTASFMQKMHRGVNDIIAFQLEGFDSSVQFTYELPPAPLQQIWRGMRDKTRNVARKADKAFIIEDSMEVDEFIRLYQSNLVVRGRTALVDMSIIRSLILASQERNCGQILLARNQERVAKAAIFCVWDNSVCYYLMSTRTPDSGNGAITLLLWRAIRRAASGGLVFDFDGLAHEGAVLLYSGFGATITPRYVVSKSSLAFRLAREGRRILEKPEIRFF